MTRSRLGIGGGRLRSRLVVTVIGWVILPFFGFAVVPDWWLQRGVINKTSLPDDFTPANHGQLKNTARAAAAEMDFRLPGGAGNAIHELVNSWSLSTAQRNDFAPLNAGQLKYVAKLFYDRLTAFGLVSRYPWEGSSGAPEDFTVCNLGQVKNLFLFDLTHLDPLRDSDHNGLPDLWEGQYFGHIGANVNDDQDNDGLDNLAEYHNHTDPGAFDTDNDGIPDGWEVLHTLDPLANDSGNDIDYDGATNLQEYLRGSDPRDYYNGQIPLIAIVSGDNQQGLPDHFLAEPLVVRIYDSGGNAAAQAAVTFTITEGSGAISRDPFTTGNSSALVYTDDDGLATAYYRSGDAATVVNRITVSSTSTTARAALTATTVASGPLRRNTIAVGENHVLALYSDGTVWSWGDNSYGQLGDGTTKQRWYRARVPALSNIVSIATHQQTSIALASDGTVWSWGRNEDNALGNGTTNNSSVPVRVLTSLGAPLHNIVAIASGYDHSLALKADGTLWAWGANWGGQLGNASGIDSAFAVPVKFPDGNFLTNVATIACGDDHNLAIKDDGTVWAWGYNGEGELGTGYSDWWNPVPMRVPGLPAIAVVCAGSLHSLAVGLDGTVWAWGLNQYGCVGNIGLNARQTVPLKLAGLDHVTAIAAGDYHSVAVKSDGTVWSWGDNHSAQLGIGPAPALSALPLEVPTVGDAFAAGAGASQSFIADKNGAILGWGSSQAGVLGNPPRTTGSKPIPVVDFLLFDDIDHDGLATWKEIILGGNPNSFSTAVDTISDSWKASYHLDLRDVALALSDALHKALTVLQDYQLGTNPTKFSSVDDAISDGWKVKNGFDPLNPVLASADLTGEGFTVQMYYQLQTTNAPVSSLKDGITDQWKIEHGIDPGCRTCAVDDSDGDGLSNVEEYLAETDPANGDTDGDGVADGNDGWPTEPSMSPLRLPKARYVLIDLGKDAIPADINNLGQVVGRVSSASAAFVWSQGRLTLPGSYAATRVNDGGQILANDGVYSPDGLITRFHINHIDTFEDLPASAFYPVDMNASGVVAGREVVRYPTQPESAIVGPAGYLQRYYRNYSTVPPYVVRAIADNGTLVGGTQIPDPAHPFIWPIWYFLPREPALIQEDSVTTLGTLAGFDWSEGHAIVTHNGSSYVSGFAWKSNVNASQSFLWHDAAGADSHGSALIELSSFAGVRRSYAWRGNQSLEMVGWSEFAVDAYSVNKYSANIWRNGQLYDLNSIVNDPRWDLQIASSINNAGAVVGNGMKEGATHGFLLVPAELMVDGNRDGEMSFSDSAVHDADQTSLERPYRFWVNDDDDTELVFADDGTPFAAELEQVPAPHPDYNFHQITSKRNLEDFTRLWVQFPGLQAAVLSGNIQAGLKWRTILAGAPAIAIYPSADDEGSLGYLKDNSGAQAQIDGVFGQAVQDVHGRQTIDRSGMFIFKPDYWSGMSTASPKKCLLFEGAGEGAGELELVFLDRNGNQIGEGGSVWIDLKDIKKMYERASATPDPLTPLPYKSRSSTFDESSINYTPDTLPRFEQPVDEAPQCLVFVHGWRMGYDDSISFSETMFKRLWWQGYQGRFAAFRWATQTSFDSYNTSEWMAWKYGKSLANYVENFLKHELPGYTMNIAAHSMGNIVTGSALQRGMTVDKYMLMQAAIPSGCYNDSVNNYADFLLAEQNRHITPDSAAENGYRLLLSSAALNVGKFISFYNANDYALQTGTTFFGISGLGWPFQTNWVQNEIDYKPNAFFNVTFDYYDYFPNAPAGARSVFFFDGANLRNVVDPHEIRSFIARPRSKAAGSDQNNALIFSAVVDLESQYGFTRDPNDHGGQFTRAIQGVHAFYRRVLDELIQ